jgi:hypothetical protein
MKIVRMVGRTVSEPLEVLSKHSVSIFGKNREVYATVLRLGHQRSPEDEDAAFAEESS